MKVLIKTIADDMHAFAVKWALEQKGVETAIWFTDNFPARTEASFHIGQTTHLDVVLRAQDTLRIAEFGTLWNRRISQPVIAPDVHQADRKFAEREAADFVQSMYSFEHSAIFEVNPGRARRIALLKPVQLVEAGKVGLRIPDTLISNSPNQVARFFKKHNGNIIFKSFSPHIWVTENGEVSSLTTALDEIQINDSEAISITPGIYQEKIEKRHEYRITFMGDRAFIAVNRSFDPSLVDSRTSSTAYDGTGMVSESVLNRCRQLMKRLGICFGCFDMIQPKDGNEPIFLEVNEMGQWLAYERDIAGFDMLEAFANFLISRDPHFNDSGHGRGLRYSDYLASPEFNVDQEGILQRLRAQNVTHNVITNEVKAPAHAEAA